jgi:hypothetical protein
MKERTCGTSAIPAANRKESAMSSIPTPAALSDAPAASQPLLEAVKKQLVPLHSDFDRLNLLGSK